MEKSKYPMSDSQNGAVGGSCSGGKADGKGRSPLSVERNRSLQLVGQSRHELQAEGVRLAKIKRLGETNPGIPDDQPDLVLRGGVEPNMDGTIAPRRKGMLEAVRHEFVEQ
jgi:hypothetical protein